jgi:hypothetical protein
MAGCGTNALTGDYYAHHKRVGRWVAIAAIATAILTYMELASAAPILVGGGVAAVYLAAIIVAAAAAAVIAFFVGFAANWFDRLHEQRPRTITVAGCIVCAGKNSGMQPFNDGDWTFNVADPLRLVSPTEAGLDENEILTRGAPGSGLDTAGRIVDPESGLLAFHCEISSHIGNWGAVGGAVGAVAGAIVGGILGAAACAALTVVTVGLGAALCALIIAALVLAGAAIGGLLGAAIGSAIGHGLDYLSDFDERGEAISPGCQMFLTGRWITDASHQHNEIHDVEAATIIECGVACGEVGAGSAGLRFAAAVGTGRHPQGVDP